MIELGGLGIGADQVWGLATGELGLLVVRGLDKVGLPHLRFHILARRKCDSAWAEQKH